MIESLMESAVIGSFVVFILCLLAIAIAPAPEAPHEIHWDK